MSSASPSRAAKFDQDPVADIAEFIATGNTTAAEERLDISKHINGKKIETAAEYAAVFGPYDPAPFVELPDIDD
ncbi:MAG: hypothetical protein IV100_29455 [Myxococcales bacterium]|nr:hypothetical protein [Myxococcales bacterium]